MKSLLTVSIPLTLFSYSLFSQINPAPIEITWSQCFGGLGEDDMFSAKATADGGVIMGGLSKSSDGDVHKNNGDFDWWVLKVDQNKDTVFSKSYGGSEMDNCRYAIGNSDGKTHMAFGSSHSIEDGDLDTSQIGNSAFCTFWLMKLNEKGEIIFQKAYNGNGVHGGRSMVQTLDGYALLGWSTSDDNCFVNNYGSYDAFLMKVDTAGNMLWTKNFGGSLKEECISILQTPDKGFVFSGFNYSNDYDFTGLNHGGKDAMVVKTDSMGNKLWSRAYGGLGDEQFLGLSLDWDGNILVCGEDSMVSGDCNNLNGGFDAWFLKLDQQTGDTLWTLNLGASGHESALRFLSLPDKGYIGLASTTSIDGLLNGQSKGHGDIWVVRLDSARNLLWSQAFGGYWGETANDMQVFDNGYMIWGRTASSDGDVVGHHQSGNNDHNRDVWAFFVVDSTLMQKSTTVIPNVVTQTSFAFSVLSLSNPGSFAVEVDLFGKQDIQMEITNSSGQLIKSMKISYVENTIKKEVDLSSYAKGVYNITVGNRSERYTKTLLIQ